MKKRENKSPSRSTKRALTSSVLALVLCFVMLLGTTFAWFTDTASTKVNKIQAGTLDVALVDKKGESLEGKTLAWQKVEDHESEEVLWEPGATYSLQPVTIKNNGNLALKYKIEITGIDGDAELNEVIDWTFKDENGSDVTMQDAVLKKGESQTLVISGTMQTTANNDYQGLKINGVSIAVYATQATVEYDSTTNQYDKNASYADPWDGESSDADGLVANTDEDEKTVIINNAAQLKAFADAVKANKTYSGYTVTLTADIDLEGYTWPGIGANNNKNFPSYFFNGTFDGQGHTIYNMTVSNLVGNYSAAGFFNGLGNNAIVKNLNFENATVTSNHYAGVVAGYCTTAAGNGVIEEPKASIENCHVNNSTVTSVAHNASGNYDDGDKAGGIIGFMAFPVKNCSVTNTTIQGVRDLGGVVGISYSSVSECSISNVTIIRDTSKIDLNQNVDSIVGRKESGYSITDCSGTATVIAGVAVSSAAELATALDDAGNGGGEKPARTIVLTSDLDMSSWTGINAGSNYPSVTIEGNGHTLKNLAAPLFYNTPGRDYTFKNINVDKANINVSKTNGSAAAFIGEMQCNGGGVVTFENCKVSNSSITSVAWAGGFVGFAGQNGSIVISNCAVTNNTITGNDGTAGLVGTTYSTVTASNTTVSGNTINGSNSDNTGTNGWSAAVLVGSSIGGNGVTATDMTIENNSCTLNTADGSNGKDATTTSYGYVVKSTAYTVNGSTIA